MYLVEQESGEILVPGSPEPATGSEDCQVYPGQEPFQRRTMKLGSEDGGGDPGGSDSRQRGQ